MRWTRVKNKWMYAKAWAKTGMLGLMQLGMLVGMKGVNKEQPCSRPPEGGGHGQNGSHPVMSLEKFLRHLGSFLSSSRALARGSRRSR